MYDVEPRHRLHADRQPALPTRTGAFRSALSHLILPAIVLGTIPLAVIARMTRSSMLEVLGEDYVRTARAKGLPHGPGRDRLHALRNALIPVVTVIGLQVGTLLAGAILTETIFAWPGVGNWLVDVDPAARLPVGAGRHPADRHASSSWSTSSSTCSTASSIRASGTDAEPRAIRAVADDLPPISPPPVAAGRVLALLRARTRARSSASR